MPEIVFITFFGSSSSDGVFPYIWNGTVLPIMRASTYFTNKVTVSENTMNWYASGSNATARHQLNESGTTYGYVAFT